jgi:signal transduction histidine kinase
MKPAFQTRILATFALALVPLAVVSIESWRSTMQLVAAANAVKDVQAALTRLEGVLSTLTDAETGVQRYIITGDERFLEPYTAAVGRLDNEVGELRRLLVQPDQQRWLADFERLMAASIKNLQTLVELQRNQGFEAARARIATGEGKQLHDQVRAAVAEMERSQYAALRERQQLIDATVHRNLIGVAVGGLLTLALGGMAWVVINRGFAALRRAEAQLHATNAELRAATEQAQAADRLKSAFLATMSHELRTPLNSIIGFTGILLQELAGPLNEEQRRQLSMVQSSARHLLALINDVLDLSKIEAGELKVRREPFDLRASIDKTVATVRPLAEKKGLVLRVEIAPEIAGAVSDARRVEQVVLNLLTNAIKFTDRGEVTLAARVVAGMAQMRVTDTGLGIKAEDMTTLFKPFQQIHTGLARAHEGTGLGLAICWRLAELLGGEIRAESEYGKGSTFTFTFPIKPAEAD